MIKIEREENLNVGDGGGSHALEAPFCFVPISRSAVEIRALKVLRARRSTRLQRL